VACANFKEANSLQIKSPKSFTGQEIQAKTSYMSKQKNLTLLLLSLTASVFFVSSTNAFACDCRSWSNAQQASLREGTLVAKVETIQNYDDGRALVKISEMLKGELAETQISVLGQDGLNCNGELIHETGQPWILLFGKTESGYHSVACGEASLPITKENKVKWKVGGEEAELSQVELRELLAFKIIPSVKGISCSLTLRRNFVTTEDSPFEMDYFKNVESSGALSLGYTEDFSARGERLSRLELSATAVKAGAGIFSLRTTLKDPFFSSTREVSRTFSMRDTYRPEPLSFLKFTNLDGGDYNDGDKGPFLAHTVTAECGLNVGFPLVPVHEK
jgi:hypothetical protein